MRTVLLTTFLIGCSNPTPMQAFQTTLGGDATAVAVDVNGRAWAVARPQGGGSELLAVDSTGAFAVTTAVTGFLGAPAPVVTDDGVWVMNTVVYQFATGGDLVAEHLPLPAARQLPAWDGEQFWIAGGSSGVPDEGHGVVAAMNTDGTVVWEATFDQSWLGMAQPALDGKGHAVTAMLDTVEGPLRVSEVSASGETVWQMTTDWLNLTEGVLARGSDGRTALGNREEVVVVSAAGLELFRVPAIDGAVFAGKRLIVPTLEGLTAYSKSGKVLWSVASEGGRCAIPAVDDFGVAYATCADENADAMTNFVAIDVKKGELISRQPLGLPWSPRPAAIRDGRLYLVAGTDEATLFVYDGVGDAKSGWSQAYGNAARTGSPQ
ncbi:MAG: PQQ-binding-like beta-propeller repeat protein [Proteobacteria bacterium]|nr:PQQ-binding-like beta-propeller repeat protein [Pseudomonadota bacterium]